MSWNAYVSQGLAAATLLAGSAAIAAEPAREAGRDLVPRAANEAAHAADHAPVELRESHILGPGDLITITVLGLKEINNQPFEIGVDGTIDPVLIGTIKAGGLTVPKLKMALRERLLKIMKDPDVGIGLTEVASQPVSVLGAVREPGVVQLKGTRRLAEVLSMAGGLEDEAGNRLTISRKIENGPLPLADSVLDSSGQYSLASIDVSALMANKAPEYNIVVRPDDVISVLKARMVYVVGDVARGGAFSLGDNEKMSVMQAVAMAEGVKHTAAKRRVKIMRGWGTDKQTEIAIDLKDIQTGVSPDRALFADDVLFVPNSKSKLGGVKALDVLTSLSNGLVLIR